MASKHERARKFIVSFCKPINSAEEDEGDDAEKAASFGGEFDGVGKGLGFVCRCIVEAAGPPAADQLLGTTPEMHAEVSQWLSFATSFDAKKLGIDGRLQLLNKHLEDRTVFAGRGLAISLADLSMFAVVHDIVSEESYPELVQLPHLLRWIDYIQSKDAAAKIYPHIPVKKAKFGPPKPSPAALASKRIAIASSSSTTEDKTAKSVKKTGAEAAASSSVMPQVATASEKVLTRNSVVVSQIAALSETATSESKAEATSTAQLEVSKATVQIAVENDKAIVAEDPAQQQRDQEVAQESSKKIKKEKPAAQKKEIDTDVSVLDIRVGVIKKVWKHPGADALYVEEIDIGEGNVRQVVSGLAKFLTPEQLQNRKVLVLRNVKPGKVRDVLSSGLVLCASNPDHTQCEPVMPPDGAQIGERIIVPGYEGASSPEEILNPKKKQFEKIQPDLTTDDTGVANYQGKPFMTSAGACTSSIVNGTIK